MMGKSDNLRDGDLYTDRALDHKTVERWDRADTGWGPLRGPNPQAILVARKEEIPRVVGEQLTELKRLRAELKKTQGELEGVTKSRDEWKKAHQDNFDELFAYRTKYGKLPKFVVGNTYKLGDLPVGSRIQSLVKMYSWGRLSTPYERVIARQAKAGERLNFTKANPITHDFAEYEAPEQGFDRADLEVKLLALPAVKTEPVRAMGVGDGYTFPSAPAVPKNAIFGVDIGNLDFSGLNLFDVRTPEQKEIDRLKQRVSKLEFDASLASMTKAIGPKPVTLADVKDEVVKALQSSVIEVTVKDDEK